MRSPELYHYGIFKQRWGIRRFQDKEGHLTEAGKERYRKKKDDSLGENKNKKEKPESKTWKSKEARYLSDSELNRRNSRLQRERQYKDLTTPQWKKTSKEINKDALKKIFVGTGVGLGVVAMRKAYPAIAKKGAQFILTNFGKHAVKWVL